MKKKKVKNQIHGVPGTTKILIFLLCVFTLKEVLILQNEKKRFTNPDDNNFFFLFETGA